MSWFGFQVEGAGDAGELAEFALDVEPVRDALGVGKAHAAEIMQAKIVDAAPSCVTVEYCECASRVNTLIDMLKPYGIREIVRTGTIAIDRGNAAVSV